MESEQKYEIKNRPGYLRPPRCYAGPLFPAAFSSFHLPLAAINDDPRSRVSGLHV